VKLKLPTEILNERKKMIEELPKKIDVGESFISGIQPHLDSTGAVLLYLKKSNKF